MAATAQLPPPSSSTIGIAVTKDVEGLAQHPLPPRRDVQAVFNYLDGGVTPEALNASRSLASPNGYGELNDAKNMNVHDVTGNEAELSLDTSGFCYVKHDSAVAKDMITMTDADIEAKYYPETADLIKKLTGASEVVVFNHLRRTSHGNNPQALGGKDKVHHQAYKVHVDQSWAQVKKHVADVYGADRADAMMAHRFQIINVWRPLRRVFKDPLAVTDLRTQSGADLLRIDVVLTDGVKTSNLAVRHSPSHRWCYKHSQAPDEPLVFKQFDSGRGVHCLGQVLHSAFADGEYEGREPRWSVEARALVVYEAQEGVQPHEVIDRGFGAESVQ